MKNPNASFAAVVLASLGWTAVVAHQGRDSGPELAIRISDFAAVPMTGSPSGAGNNDGALARVNFIREEPAAPHRFFANDLTGPLYILNRVNRKFTTYLDFNGRGTRPGLFDKLATGAGLASGFISFEFDPDYGNNGRFYTIHLEEIAAPGVLRPDNTSVPRLDVSSYVPADPVQPPGETDHEAVLIEWTDTKISNWTFEGTARELLRIRLNSRIHPVGDLAFNPVARRGDPDWRVLYVACGDGGSGDQRTAVRLNPQRLDTLVGKILRIVPDLREHAQTSTVSANGRYRIPRDNPFVNIDGARGEIWAYGLRNPHRLSWGPDNLIASVIGWRTWETVVVIHKGANYGYPLREGNQRLGSDGSLIDLPDNDAVPVQVTDTATAGTAKPTYPVLEYGHGPNGGDAIAGGFVYRGASVPGLRGKYILGDISTGRLWYADYQQMLAADDGNPATLAELHELPIYWDDPSDKPDSGPQLYPTMAPVAQVGYHARGGMDPDLPGAATVSGSGRVDLRFAVDRSGELYLLTKSDGMIRAVSGIGPKPSRQTTAGADLSARREAFLRLIDRPRVPLSPQLDVASRGADILHEHFTIAAQMGERIPGIVSKAEGGRVRRPAIIILHGTGGSKEDERIVRLSETLAGRGFITVSMDGRYHGERATPGARAAEYVDAILRAYRTGKEHPFLYDTVWDVMRVVDYLVTRPDVDPARIGLTGISKGGMETYLAAAVDPRIAAAVPVIGVQSFRWALEHDSWQSRVGTFQAAVDRAAADAGILTKDAAFIRRFYDRVAPGIYGEFDAPAMLPLIAPRPLLAINGDSDPRTPMPGVRESISEAEQVYTAANASERLSLYLQPDTAHAFTKAGEDRMIDWFVRWLKP